MTGQTLPGETSGDLTRQWISIDWCNGTTSQSPCVEIDEIDRLTSSTTTTTRAFYDGECRLVETRTPGPVGQDVVTYVYNGSAGRMIFKSNPTPTLSPPTQRCQGQQPTRSRTVASRAQRQHTRICAPRA